MLLTLILLFRMATAQEASAIRSTFSAVSFGIEVQNCTHLAFHSFILETYIVPLQDTTTQKRTQHSHCQRRKTSRKCKIWKGLAISNERSSTGRSFHADGPTTEKALRCTVAKWARWTKSSPLAAERSTRRAAKTENGQQRSQR